MSEEEKKYRKTGMIVSISVHLALVLLFFFLLAWREPDPPLPQYGIELNFGLDNTGSGETQQPQPTERVTEAEQNVTETQEEVIEEVPEEISETVPETPEETVTEEAVTENETSTEVTQPVESPVVEKEKTVHEPNIQNLAEALGKMGETEAGHLLSLVETVAQIS